MPQISQIGGNGKNYKLQMLNAKLKNKNSLGMSLMEILVVIGIFAVLGTLTTRAILLTLGGGKKTETVIKVRENLSYALGVISRQLRNADLVTNCTNANTLQINYLDDNGVASTFSCANIGPGTVGYVASGSAKLTNDSIDITSCAFTCTNNGPDKPSSVRVDLEAQDATTTGISNISVSSSTEVLLRNY